MEKGDFPPAWRALAGPEQEASAVLKDVPTADPAAVQAKLAAAGVHFVASRPGPDPSFSMHYYSARGANAAGAPAGALLLLEITFKTGLQGMKVVLKTAAGIEPLGRLALAAVEQVLRA